MRECAIKEIFESIVRMRGIDPNVATLSAGQRAVIAEQINGRMIEVWEYTFWPQLIQTEQRQYRDTWDDEDNYTAGEEVYFESDDGTEQYYTSLKDENVNHQPDEVDSEWWEAVGDDFQRTIAFRQDGQTEIGAVDLENGVFDRDPRIYRMAGLVRDVIEYEDGIQVIAEEAPVRPWLRFRTPPPVYSLTAWSATSDYAIEDTCYLASTGRSYKALQSSTNKSPDSQTAYWEPVDFPFFLRRWMINAVHADYCLDPIEQGKAENRAAEELERLNDTLVDQHGNVRKATFRR